MDIDVEKTNADKHRAIWAKCKCNCGNEKSIRLSFLKNGQTKSCGCLRYKPTTSGPQIEMIGKKFGRLTVKREKKPEEYPDGKRQRIQWYCDCDCGTKDYVVDGANLRSGHTISCGCYNREMSHKKNSRDWTGKKVGRLTPIKIYKNSTRKRAKKSNLWLCKCDCWNFTVVSSNSLATKGTVSCGCIVSKNEELIRNILVDKNVKFKTQFWFSDLRSPYSNCPLRFDFAILDENGCIVTLIEFDGQQHFSGTRFSPDPEVNNEKFKRLQTCDKLKNEYCEKNGFSLFRIPYTYEKDIEKLLLQNLKSKGVI